MIPLMKLMASARVLALADAALVALDDDESGVVVAFAPESRICIPDGYSFANCLPARNSSLLSNSGDWIICASSFIHSSPYVENCDSSTSQHTAPEITPSVKDLEAVVHDRHGMMDTGWSYDVPASAAFCDTSSGVILEKSNSHVFVAYMSAHRNAGDADWSIPVLSAPVEESDALQNKAATHHKDV